MEKESLDEEQVKIFRELIVGLGKIQLTELLSIFDDETIRLIASPEKIKAIKRKKESDDPVVTKKKKLPKDIIREIGYAFVDTMIDLIKKSKKRLIRMRIEIARTDLIRILSSKHFINDINRAILYAKMIIAGTESKWYRFGVFVNDSSLEEAEELDFTRHRWGGEQFFMPIPLPSTDLITKNTQSLKNLFNWNEKAKNISLTREEIASFRGYRLNDSRIMQLTSERILSGEEIRSNEKEKETRIVMKKIRKVNPLPIGVIFYSGQGRFEDKQQFETGKIYTFNKLRSVSMSPLSAQRFARPILWRYTVTSDNLHGFSMLNKNLGRSMSLEVRGLEWEQEIVLVPPFSVKILSIQENYHLLGSDIGDGGFITTDVTLIRATIRDINE